MKRFLSFLLVLALMIPVSVHAEEGKTEAVIQMPYGVQMPDVYREGFYTGETLNGVPHGYGVFVAINSEYIYWHYLGQWVNGEMCGQGGQYWDNGECRVGIYEKNRIILGEIHTTPLVNMPVDRR